MCTSKQEAFYYKLGYKPRVASTFPFPYKLLAQDLLSV